MSLRDKLADRLRQAIQGCTIHSHGPVQAWAAIEQADGEGEIDAKEVARIAVAACEKRIEDLRAAGVTSDDPRIKKEDLTRAFIERLLL